MIPGKERKPTKIPKPEPKKNPKTILHPDKPNSYNMMLHV